MEKNLKVGDTVNLVNPKEGLEKAKTQCKDFLSVLYKICYLTGITCIRRGRRLKRRLKPVYQQKLYPVVRRTYYLATYPFRALRRLVGKKVWRLRYCISRCKQVMQAAVTGFRKKEYGEAFSQVGVLAKWGLRAGRTVLNYAMPVCGAAVLCLTIQHYNNQTLAIQVEYAGKNIGYILNEEDFSAAEQAVEDRIIYEEYQKPFDFVPKFTLTRVDKDELTSTDELTDEIIRASGNEITEASGLYVDDEFIGAVEEPDSLLMLLDDMLDEYKVDGVEKVEFSNKIELKDGLYPVSGVVSVDEIDGILNSEVQGKTVYTTKLGDSPWSIAASNDISIAELRSMNDAEEIDNLKVGQEVTISQAQSFLGVRVTKIEEYEQTVPYETEQVASDSLFKGYNETTTEGRNGVEAVKAEVTYENGVEVGRSVLSTTVVEPVQNRVVTYGTKTLQSFSNVSSANAPAFIWPVAGGYVSCGFQGYVGHTGMDIAAPRGTNIYASASGVVTLARSFWPLGTHIIITHGDGVQTVYAHCSALYVTEGQVVQQGQVIAAVGSTGNSTGNHCHFEIRLNGQYVNPAYYL